MTGHPGAEGFLPAQRSITAMERAVQGCHGCDLYRHATQAVFGAGARQPELVLIGEQPGDVEDREGEPFVGPAGRLLDHVLAEAGVDPARTYRTNIVKHFRFQRTSGKRRIHQRPTQGQVTACRPWVLAELSALHPPGMVLLGATAAQALLGSSFRVSEQRGQLLDSPVESVEWAVATVHPSSVLRSRERDRERDRATLVADLRVAADQLDGGR